MLLRIHPDNPQARLVQQVASCLKKGGVIIYPTDTLYAFGCDIHSRKALERICRIKGINPEKAQFSCICPDIKAIGEFAIQISNPVFKFMRKNLPGPYTIVLKASKQIPRHFQSKKKTAGFRISDHPIPMAIIAELGNPILTSSLHWEDDADILYGIEPHSIYEKYGKLVDMVIDGGYGDTEPSTVLDCSDGDFEVIRMGKGEF